MMAIYAVGTHLMLYNINHYIKLKVIRPQRLEYKRDEERRLDLEARQNEVEQVAHSPSNSLKLLQKEDSESEEDPSLGPTETCKLIKK
jgi:hypothetical protein